MLDALLKHLDSWLGDWIAKQDQFKEEPQALFLANISYKLAVSVLRNYLGSPDKIKLLRRFLATMLPSESTADEGNALSYEVK